MGFSFICYLALDFFDLRLTKKISSSQFLGTWRNLYSENVTTYSGLLYQLYFFYGSYVLAFAIQNSFLERTQQHCQTILLNQGEESIEAHHSNLLPNQLNNVTKIESNFIRNKNVNHVEDNGFETLINFLSTKNRWKNSSNLTFENEEINI